MPAGGMAMTEGTVIEWLKEPGDPVVAGEPVVEVETDKTTLEVESPGDGVLAVPCAGPGAVIEVGGLLAWVLEPGEDAPPAPVSSVVAESRSPDSESSAIANGAVETVPATDHRHAAGVGGNGSPAGAGTLTVTATAAAPTVPRLIEPGARADVPPFDVDDLPLNTVLEWLRTAALIRRFEEVSDPLAERGKIPGGMHSAAGQEGVAVGTIGALAPTDIVTSSHRSHHHALAKGLTPRSVMAELYGKATGCLGGRGGHMHLADFSIGLYGSNGIVGGGLGIAMGAALAARLQGLDQVALAFFGDGGANTGRVWEFVNLAAVWHLPLVIVCENNLYAVETHIGRAMAGTSVADRASGFGLPCEQVDGQDPFALYQSTARARQRAASGDGPTFIEALTYRYRGHNTSDPERYRERAEVEEWRRRDPVLRLRDHLIERHVIDVSRFEAIVGEVAAVVDDAVEFAEESPWPDPATATHQVTGIGWHPRSNP